jgi:SAM-dependent methyltransferase
MIEVPSMPLYWRARTEPVPGPDALPQRMPFVFDYDSRHQLVIEKRSPGLTAVLDDIYSRDANVGYLQDGHSLAKSYGADFWDFLTGLIGRYPVRSVLEVGCGGCVLLERLKAQGCHVVGVDPSPVAREAGARKGIEVVVEPFPTARLKVKPDLIVQVDVLEHIEDPVAFLQAQMGYIDNAGLIVVNVPNCTRSIARGDISMALHQHVNMFDDISLPAVFRAAGLDVVQLERSNYGSALYCVGRKAQSVSKQEQSAEVQDRWRQFESKAKAGIESFRRHVEKAREREESIGFFMPQRAFPYLGTMDQFDGFRFFDNSSAWHRRYLDGLDVPIENQGDLVASPVDHLFIMSLTFGKEVADSLRKEAPGLKITTIDEILS